MWEASMRCSQGVLTLAAPKTSLIIFTPFFFKSIADSI